MFEQFGVDGKLYVDIIMTWWFYGDMSKWTTPPGVTYMKAFDKICPQMLLANFVANQSNGLGGVWKSKFIIFSQNLRGSWGSSHWSFMWRYAILCVLSKMYRKLLSTRRLPHPHWKMFCACSGPLKRHVEAVPALAVHSQMKRRELCGTKAHTSAQTHTSVPSPGNVYKNVFWCAARLKAKDVNVLMKTKTKMKQNMAVQPHTTPWGGDITPFVVQQISGCAFQQTGWVPWLHNLLPSPVEQWESVGNCNQRLQALVRVHPTQIQHGFAIEGARKKSLYSAEGNQLSPDQGSYPNSAAGREAEQFLLEVFSGPKERQGVELCALNKYMRKFRMLKHTALIQFVRPGDWFISIDLKDTNFHIPIYPPHRIYLWFAFQGITYEYLVLLFSLSLSPQGMMGLLASQSPEFRLTRDCSCRIWTPWVLRWTGKRVFSSQLRT